MTSTRPRYAAITIAAVLVAAMTWIVTKERAHGAAAERDVLQAQAPEANAPLGITYATAQAAAISPSISLTGTVSVLPSQTVTVSPRVQGQVIKVFVQVGDHVRAGQTLALLRSLDIASAESAFRQAQTQVRYAALALQHQKRLAQLGSFTQKPLEDARTAVTAANGALMSDQSSYQQDMLTVQQDQSAVLQDQTMQRQDEMDEEHDRQQAEREQKLFQEGIHALQDLESAQNTSHKDEEKIRGDQEKVDGDRLKVQGDQTKVAGDQSRIRSDENQVRINKEALERESRTFSTNVYAAQAVEQAQSAYYSATGQLQQAQDTLRIDGVNDRTSVGLVEVKSPISGTVVSRSVNPGVSVDTSTQTPWQMFTIDNIDSVDIDANAYDQDLSHLRIGMSVSAHTPAFPRARYSGQVSYISPVEDQTTHATKVRCQISNPAHQLKDGMYVDVQVKSALPQSVLLVPAAAVQSDARGPFVFLAGSSGAFMRRPVTVGREAGDKIEITGGLLAGQRVVASGAILLSDNSSGDD